MVAAGPIAPVVDKLRGRMIRVLFHESFDRKLSSFQSHSVYDKGDRGNNCFFKTSVTYHKAHRELKRTFLYADFCLMEVPLMNSIGEQTNSIEEQLANSIGEQANSIEEQVNGIEEQANNIEEQVDSIEDQVDSIEEQVDSIGEQAPLVEEDEEEKGIDGHTVEEYMDKVLERTGYGFFHVLLLLGM